MLGVGSFTATVVGTGAFSSVSAERQISVKVADDDDAYLTIDPSSQWTRSTTSSGEVEFYIPGLKNRAGVGGPEGDGIAPNSTYTFSSLAKIQNQGSDPVEVFSVAPTLPSGFERLSLVNSDQQDLLNMESNATELAPGESFWAGLLIETGSANTGDHNLSLVIHADPTTESSSSSPSDPPGL